MEQILCDELTEGLKLLSDPNVCNDECFKTLLEKANLLLKYHTIPEHANIVQGYLKVYLPLACNVAPGMTQSRQFTLYYNIIGMVNDQQQMVLSLLVLLTEFCRRGFETQQLDIVLKDHNFSSKRIEMIMKLYMSTKIPVTLELDATGKHLPHIVGANWSLDCTIKDSSSESVNTLQFLVDLETHETGGIEEHVEFVCSLDEMQDFVSQLKEATKHVEKMATG